MIQDVEIDEVEAVSFPHVGVCCCAAGCVGAGTQGGWTEGIQ